MATADNKKERIIEAARECLSRYGFEKTTMADIGRLVEIDKASLYYYYKNKEDLLSEVVFLSTKEFIESLQAKITKIKGFRDKITVYLDERLQYYMQVLELHNLSLETFKLLQPLFLKLYRIVLEKEVDFLSSILEEAHRSRDIKQVDTRRVARCLLMIADAAKQAMARDDNSCMLSNESIPDLKEEILFPVGLILDGLKP